MWTDNETDNDFINFGSVADTIAEIINQANERPISIGVSGSWGVGKSSLIKLVNKSLRKNDPELNKYIFVEFNAWLYQGYDDTRAALMEVIANKLIEAAKENENALGKAKNFLARVNWLRVAGMAASTVIPMAFGLPPVGLAGLIAGQAKNIMAGQADSDQVNQIVEESTEIAQGLLKPPREYSPPREMQAIRDSFEDTLQELGSTLVVLIDDLDRCLPETTISTLEGIRLFLFLPRTAFVIAADKKMIRHAVRKHFDGIDDELVTNYFDKLIQVPIQVPPLSTQDVRAYMMLLFVDNSSLSPEDKEKIVAQVNSQLKLTWQGNRVDRTFLTSMDGINLPSELLSQLETVERLAPIMASAEQIKGNPRLIKRFLNAISIRKLIARSNGISINEQALVKMLLFERCGNQECYDELLAEILSSNDGKSAFLKEWEKRIKDGTEGLPEKWNNEFEVNWIQLPPSLSDIDLRGILYVSREHSPLIMPEDKMSLEASDLISSIIRTPGSSSSFKSKFTSLSKAEISVLMDKLLECSSDIGEWGKPDILDDLLFVASIDEKQSERLRAFLMDRPINQIKPSIIPKISTCHWFKEVTSCWLKSDCSPTLKKAIKRGGGE